MDIPPSVRGLPSARFETCRAKVAGWPMTANSFSKKNSWRGVQTVWARAGHSPAPAWGSWSCVWPPQPERNRLKKARMGIAESFADMMAQVTCFGSAPFGFMPEKEKPDVAPFGANGKSQVSGGPRSLCRSGGIPDDWLQSTKVARLLPSVEKTTEGAPGATVSEPSPAEGPESLLGNAAQACSTWVWALSSGESSGRPLICWSG